MRRLLAVLAAIALFTAACGNDDNPAVGGGGGDHNEADVAFAQGMIPHHEQAVEMAEMAVTQSTRPEVKALAVRIKDAQGPEITTMRGWLQAWGEPVPAQGGAHDMGGHAGAMLSDEEMSRMQAASGAEFDRMFLEGMIRHHEGAVTMAEEELQKGQFPEAKQLAQQIIDAQRAEIAEMRDLLAR